MKQTKITPFLVLVFAVLLAIPFDATKANPTYVPCPGYESQLSVGKQARVIPGNSVRIRQEPTTSAAELNNVPENSIVMILAGSQCGDDFTWWKARYRSTIGWMAEGQNDVHWLDTNLTTAAPPSAPVDSASGTAAQVVQASHEVCLSFDPGTSIVYGETAVQSGSRVDYSIDNLSPPLICTANTADAVALTPDGTAVTPEVTDKLENGAVFSVSLPEWAYTIPGVWTLSAGGASLQINVQPTARPFLDVSVVQAPVSDSGAILTRPAIMTAPLPVATQAVVPTGRIAAAELSNYLSAVMPTDEVNSFDVSSRFAATLADNSTIINTIAAQNGTLDIINDNVAVVALPDRTDPTYVDTGQRESSVTLAGFVPGEGVVLVSGTVTVRGSIEFDLSSISGTRVTVDDGGFFVGDVTTQGPILLAFSQSRQIVIHGRFTFSNQDALINELYDAFFAVTDTQPLSTSGNSNPIVYYESGSGNMVVGQLDPTGKYEDVAYPSPLAPGYTHVVGSGNRQVLFYNANTGVGQVAQIAADGNLIPQTAPTTFTVGWTHIVEGGGQLLFYRSTDGFAALARIEADGTVNTLANYSITPGWTAVAGNSGWYILYNRTDGSYETMQFFADGTTTSTGISSSGQFSAGWTHIVGYNGKLLFYNTDTGVTAFGTFSGGYYNQISGYPAGTFSAGWTHIVAADDRLLYYNASVRNAETVIFHPDGSYAVLEIISRLSGWTNITAATPPS